MADPSHAKPNAHRRVFWLLLILLLAVLAWTGRYWMSSEFGLYEDDLTFIPGAIEATFDEVLRIISGYFSTLAEQGRPFMWSFVILFAHLGWRLGGLQAMYLLAFSIWFVNILLFVFLLKRLRVPFFFAAVAGLSYVLFSADTNQAFLFNAYGLQPAISFLLIALHLYLVQNRWRWLAYLFLALVMFTYETPFWLFLAAPLLTQDTGKTLWRKVWVNTALTTVIFLVIYVLRVAVGESRVASLGFPEILITPIKHMLVGPLVSIGTFALRIIQVLRQVSVQALLAAGLSGGLIFALLFWLGRSMERAPISLLPFKRGWWERQDALTQQMLRLLGAGIMMLVFAYPLTFILRPYAVSGRETRVHMAAVLGSAFLIASILTLLYGAIRQKGLSTGLLIIVSLVLGFNLAYGIYIQEGYQRAWDLQQRFWTQLIPLIGDVKEGTAILVQPEGLEDVHYIDANTWNLPKLLPQMYIFPEKWAAEPQVFRLIDGWQDNIIRVPGYFTLDGSNTYANMVVFGDFLQKNTILVSAASGTLERQFETQILDETILLKPSGKDVLSTLETRPLYHLLVDGE